MLNMFTTQQSSSSAPAPSGGPRLLLQDDASLLYPDLEVTLYLLQYRPDGNHKAYPHTHPVKTTYRNVTSLQRAVAEGERCFDQKGYLYDHKIDWDSMLHSLYPTCNSLATLFLYAPYRDSGNDEWLWTRHVEVTYDERWARQGHSMHPPYINFVIDPSQAYTGQGSGFSQQVGLQSMAPPPLPWQQPSAQRPLPSLTPSPANQQAYNLSSNARTQAISGQRDQSSTALGPKTTQKSSGSKIDPKAKKVLVVKK